MNREECIRLLKIERECVLRQDTPKCQRQGSSDTCFGCDLCQGSNKIEEMYNSVIDFLMKDEEMMVNMAEIIKMQDEVIERGSCYVNRKEM